MQFVALNIDLDQINAFPGFEIIVEHYHFNFESAACVSLGEVNPMINIQFIGKIEHGLATAFSNRCLQDAYIWQLASCRTQSPEILWRRFERMDDAGSANTTGQKLRINAHICASVHNDRAR